MHSEIDRQIYVRSCTARLSAVIALLVLAALVLSGCRSGFGNSPSPVAGSDTLQNKIHATAPTELDPALDQTDRLTASFLDIAPGNCIVLKLPSGKHVMIDAGPVGSEQDVLTRLQDLSVDRLDYIVVTCQTPEHIGCLPALLGGVTFGEIITTAITSPAMSKLDEVVRRDGGKKMIVRNGSSVPLDDQVSLEVLAPGPGVQPIKPNDDWYENHSLVFRVRYNRGTILFTGDMGATEKRWLTENATNLQAVVLSGLHHGDSKLGDLEFIHRIAPLAAVLMCTPGNAHGYPHTETLESLNSEMVKLYRTDLEANVEVYLQAGGQLSILPSHSASDKQLTLPGSEVKGVPTSQVPVRLDNPLDKANGNANGPPDLLR